MIDQRKRVLLFSGGVDSSALALLWPHDEKLYVNMHTRYAEAELYRLKFRVMHKEVENMTVVDLPLNQWERPDGIIPMRNLLLVALASIYGDDIAYGAIAGERMLDKTPTFAALSTVLLSYLWAPGEKGRRPQGWTDGRTIKVHQPIVELTKAQVIARVIEEGHDAEALAREAWSCYEPGREDYGWKSEVRCGNCKPCVRNWLAFYANGIRLPYTPQRHVIQQSYLTGRGEESEIAKRALVDLGGRA